MNFKTFFSKLKPNKALLPVIGILVFAFFISTFSLFLAYLLKNLNPSEYGLIQGCKQDLEITYKEILFFASIILAFFFLSLSLRYIKKRKLKMALIAFVSIYLTACYVIVLIDSVYYLIFSSRISFSAVQTILNTNPDEVKGFINLYYSPARVGALLLFLTMFVFIILRRFWFSKVLATRAFFIISLLLSVLGIIDFAQVAHSKGNGPHNVRYWDVIIGEYNEFQEFNRRLSAETTQHADSKEYESYCNQDTLKKTIVFVISESISKRHMSCYGYSRNTTPFLKRDTNSYLFNNCVSQAALTIDAVPGLFFNGFLSKKTNLITLLNKLNYKTSWISNQSGWGKGDRSIVLLSQLCNERIFTDNMADNDKANASVHYDEEVLLPFSNAIRASPGTSKFIVLHLMGCHFDYEKRFPFQKTVFSSAPPAQMAVRNERSNKIVNAYDNAMLYHDSIVNEIVSIFSKETTNKNAALVFLADHGEELYENRNYAGHGYPPTKAMAEVPYFVSLSSEFKNNFPSLVQIIKKRESTSYSTVNNFYTLLNLLNINSKKYQHKILKNSFFSPIYDSTQTRFIMGLDYSKIER